MIRAQLEVLRLTEVTDGGETTQVFETKRVTPGVDELWQRLPAVFQCGNCRYTLGRHNHREYLPNNISSYLRDLLWKFFDGKVGKKSEKWCSACSFEAAHGTEEVPHPVDKRLHTCIEQ